jgi:hypothetical protein
MTISPQFNNGQDKGLPHGKKCILVSRDLQASLRQKQRIKSGLGANIIGQSQPASR